MYYAIKLKVQGAGIRYVSRIVDGVWDWQASDVEDAWQFTSPSSAALAIYKRNRRSSRNPAVTSSIVVEVAETVAVTTTEVEVY